MTYEIETDGMQVEITVQYSCPICGAPECDCFTNPDNQDLVSQWEEDGLISAEMADFYRFQGGVE